jgi:hypothetical protein
MGFQIAPLYRLVQTTAQSMPPPGGTGSSGRLTCNGKAATAAAQTFTFVAQDNRTKQILPNTFSVLANSSSEAQACAQNLIDRTVSNATAVPLSAIAQFWIVSRTDGECLRHSIRNTSSADAITALKASFCSNCTYEDITAAVTNPDGSIDISVVDHWCD